MEQTAFIQLIEQRLMDIFNRYRQGLDVPPATVFRTEGLLEAAVHFNYLSATQAQQLISKNYQQVFKRELEDFGNDLHIPLQMTRAPVYPSK